MLKFVAVALIVGSYSLTAWAAWGDLDASFGFGGFAYDSVTNHVPRSVFIQADGKILVTGYRTPGVTGNRFFLRRYNANGSLDTTFGTNGSASGVPEGVPKSHYRGESIVILPNGKIAVAGYANGFYGVWKFSTNGVADTAFGTNGMQVLTGYPISLNNSTPEINVQNTRILLSLRKEIAGDWRVVLVRLGGTGEHDTTFGTGGEAITEFDGTMKGYDGTEVGSNGRITVSGYKYYNISEKNMERKLTNGQPDLTFSSPTQSAFGIISPGLVKMANGKYAMRGANPSNNPFPMVPFAEKWTSAGVFQAAQTPVTAYPSGSCPQIFRSENSGKLLVFLSSFLYRMDAELSAGSIEISNCANLTAVTSKSRAALQADDKMVTAGVVNGDMVLVRTLP